MSDKELSKLAQELLEKAFSGNEAAQYFVSAGYTRGDYGFEKNHQKLMELAENGWKEAQHFVSSGYTYGWYGFEQDIKKGLELQKKWNLKGILDDK